jgi:hypothetical protein
LFNQVNQSGVLEQTTGLSVVDTNGDGRQDILRWEDTAANNALYVSNGDGSLTTSTTFNLGGIQLQSADGTSSFVIGDFTGHGNSEILRLQTPSSGSPNNQLYVKVDPTPADQLISVTNGTGATTNLCYVPLSNPTQSNLTPNNCSSASLGARYTNDRGTANAATGSAVDLQFPMYVVATSLSDSGVGAGRVATEYSYAGLKADMNGRGLLGFRDEQRQSPGADGNALTVDTQYLQTFPYIGVASRSDTYNASLNAIGSGNLLSSTVNVYCDTTSAAAPASATATSPCATTALVTQPYLYQSTETGTDLNGAALPTVVTQNSFNGSGDPLTIAVTTSGTTPGLVAGDPTQTFTKTTTNTYQPEDTSCSDFQTCNWIKGRLSRATVNNSVPNLLAGITTGAGRNPNASDTQGNGATQTAALGPNLVFPTVIVGSSSAPMTATLANNGAAALSVTIPSASSVSGADFSFVSTNCSSSLAVGASCGITIKFTPTTYGVRSGTLSVGSGAGTLTATLSGTGDAPPATVTGAAFGAAYVTSGNTVNFSWATSGAVSATVACSGAASGSGSGTSGSITVTTSGTGTATCAVSATNASGDITTRSGTTNVIVAPSVASAAFAASNVTASQSVGFSWTTSNATSASVACSGAVTGSGTGLNSSLTASAGASVGAGTCTVTASNAAGTQVTRSSTVNVVAPPSVTGVSFGATNVTTGDSVSLTWGTSGATSASVNCSGAAVGTGSGTSGIISVNTSGTGAGTCTVTATNVAGSTATASASTNVVARPTISAAGFANNYVTTSQGIAFTWTVANAVSSSANCSGAVSGSASGTSTGGSVTAVAGTSTGTGTCAVVASNAAGTAATASANVGVVLPPTTYLLNFNPSTVGSGSTSTFGWSTSNATSATVTCAAPAYGSGSGLQGNFTVTTSGTGIGTCTVTAVNAAGTTAVGSANLTVNPAGAILSSNPTYGNFPIAPNGSTTVTFTITNNASVAATGLTIGLGAKTGSGKGTFSLAGGTCVAGGTLNGGATCTVVVQYADACGPAANNYSTLTVSGTNVGTPASVNLNGSNTAGSCV